MNTRNTSCQHGREDLEVTDGIGHFGTKTKVIGKEYKCRICGYTHTDSSGLLGSLVSDDGRHRGGQLPDRVDLEKRVATDSDWDSFESARNAG